MEFVLFLGLLFSLFVLVVVLRFLIVVPDALSKIVLILQYQNIDKLGNVDDDPSDDEDDGMRYV